MYSSTKNIKIMKTVQINGGFYITLRNASNYRVFTHVIIEVTRHLERTSDHKYGILW